MSKNKELKKIQDELDEIEKSSFTQNCYEWLHAIIIAIVIVVLLLTFGFRRISVDGESMMNTLHDRDQVLVTNLLDIPNDGDIVIISHGQEYKQPIIKRVIATEGQTLQIDFEKHQVIVDGVIIDEPYIKDPTTVTGNTEIPQIIPKGKVFVMGDNRNHSTDSRFHEIGLIDVKDIIGKAEFIIFPFDRFKSIA
ncbi:signal peptidase I [Clostridia bacterium]|nr:signal peptidase I [Clostridia bacterium]